MRIILLLFFVVVTTGAFSQVTVSPTFPTADQPVTITYDAAQGTSALVGANRVFMHSGVILSGPTGTGWQHVVGTWGSPNSSGEMTSLGGNKWAITITPREYYAAAGLAATARVYRLGMVFREAGPCGGFSGASAACKEGKSPANADIYVDIQEENQFSVAFTEPTAFPLFVNNAQQITITANASAASTMTVKINGVTVKSDAGVNIISYQHTVTGESGFSEVVVEANNGTETKSISFKYIVRAAVAAAPRPAGIIDGINYGADPTKVTLSLWAPGKSSVYVLGDFTDWEIDPTFAMKKDGEHFWIELTALTSGQEYAFQYLIDETIYVADPYTDKILDKDDTFIPASTYPDLKAFPAKAEKDQWYFNKLAVFQTGQQPYNWQVTNFQKPAKEKLVIYELLVRDFFGEGEKNYQNLIDTLGYFKKLGINAIELMPINEFNGNDSWGYNPTFMFAPDKFYGTKNKLKEFIDKCHQNGIAVIIDIVMNHQDIPNPYVLMDYDFGAGKPQPDNKWFNTDARHPFNVFFDMNHESSYTKKYLDTVNHYWMNEYKVDGYRFDLSKGFTQQNNPSDVGAWSAYDASRIALLKRMADKIWGHTPDGYIILEHLSVNSEEKELAEYRSDEGKGMMLWGKMTEAYSQNAMGYAEHSDLSGVYHTSRGWTVPHLIGYMESHDEERLMVSNALHGKNASGHNTKTTSVALKRMAAAATMFYTVPGPKMLWQFGELGYDFSINHCPDGTVNNDCRVSSKPVKWEYRDDEERYALYQHIADLNRLRLEFDIFTNGVATFPAGGDLKKVMVLKNDPYTTAPSSPGQMNAVVVVNFDVQMQNVSVDFPHIGVWYDYYEGGIALQITNTSTAFSIKPGDFKIFTDYPIESPITSIDERSSSKISVFPNPVDEVLQIANSHGPVIDLVMIDQQGREYKVEKLDENAWSVRTIPRGFFVAQIKTKSSVQRVKILKK